MNFKRYGIRNTGAIAAALFASAALVGGPSLAAAQTCLGAATLPGQFSIGGFGTFADNSTAYGVESRSNLPGNLGMGARIGLVDLDGTDEDLTSVGGYLAVELPARGAVGICPVLGVDYDFWSGTLAGADLDFSRLAFPLGVSIGSRLGDADGIAVIPAAQLGLMHQRFSGTASAGPLLFQREGTRNDLYLDAGAGIQINRIEARAGIFRIFEDDAETVFRVGVGFVF
ncbi:hypothetical protein BH23GEM11_BH23GEM11_09570 [soil metagenome]